jgi:hypothetical protein
LRDETGIGQRERFEISPDWPTGEWPANAIARDRYSFQIDPRLRGGAQTVALGLVRPESGHSVEYEEVGQVWMEAPERVFSVPPMEQTVGGTFANRLRLLGYDLDVTADQVRVVLHWRALRRMDESYKIFLHLLDPETGELVAQRDVVPRKWTYPTSWWEIQEVVSDELVLPLQGVAPGRYQLCAGVYQPNSGERLPVSDPGSAPNDEADRLRLSEVTVR